MAGLLETLSDFGTDLRARRQERLANSAYRQQAGLLKPLLSQFGAETAQQVGSALLSDSPEARAIGGGLLQQLLMQRGQMGLTPQQQAELAWRSSQIKTEEMQQEKLGLDIDQARKLGPLNLQATQSLIAQRNAAAQASLASAEAARRGKISETADRINQRWVKQIATPTEVADAVQQISGALKTGDPLGALAATVKLAKVLDPQSVVREGEVTTVEGGTGLAENLVRTYNRVIGNGGFSPEGAKQLERVAKSVAAPVLQRGLRIESELRTAADNLELDPTETLLGTGWQGDWVRQYLQDADDPGRKVGMDLGRP